METLIESFGTIIKEIRKEQKMTQKMLSQDICSQSVLSRIENNEELPNVLVMCRQPYRRQQTASLYGQPGSDQRRSL